MVRVELNGSAVAHKGDVVSLDQLPHLPCRVGGIFLGDADLPRRLFQGQGARECWCRTAHHAISLWPTDAFLRAKKSSTSPRYSNHSRSTRLSLNFW